MVTSLGVMGITVRYRPKPDLLRQRLPADQRLLAPRHHLRRHLPGRPAADWLSVDVHDVLIHNRRRSSSGGFNGSKAMSTKPFVYQEAFPLAQDETEYYLLSKEHVSVAEFDGQEILKVEPEA
jgi:hypothetical protein